ncbi:MULTISPECIES: hypothetical protein [unclassified Campylobacter]
MKNSELFKDGKKLEYSIVLNKQNDKNKKVKRATVCFVFEASS